MWNFKFSKFLLVSSSCGMWINSFQSYSHELKRSWIFTSQLCTALLFLSIICLVSTPTPRRTVWWYQERVICFLTQRAFFIYAGEQLQCAALLVMLWTVNLFWTQYYHLLPSLCTQFHSLTTGINCICVYPLKHLQIGLNVNDFSTPLNYWVAAGAVGEGCLNQWPLKRYPPHLLFTRLDAELFFFRLGTIQ